MGLDSKRTVKPALDTLDSQKHIDFSEQAYKIYVQQSQVDRFSTTKAKAKFNPFAEPMLSFYEKGDDTATDKPAFSLYLVKGTKDKLQQLAQNIYATAYDNKMKINFYYEKDADHPEKRILVGSGTAFIKFENEKIVLSVNLENLCTGKTVNVCDVRLSDYSGFKEIIIH
jgi:hypothetical protein